MSPVTMSPEREITVAGAQATAGKGALATYNHDSCCWQALCTVSVGDKLQRFGLTQCPATLQNGISCENGNIMIGEETVVR